MKVSVDAYVERMRQRMDQAMREVIEAVNSAPDGAWINASEMKVRDVFAEIRREAYEMALQMRLDATQAAFSPCGQGERQTAFEQRP